MKKTEIIKKFELTKIEKLKQLKEVLKEFNQDLESIKNKTFRNPLKDQLLEQLKKHVENVEGLRCHLTKNNEIRIYYNFSFYYYDFKKFFIDKISTFKQNRLSYTKDLYFYTSNFNIDFDYKIIFDDNKINNNNIHVINRNIDDEIININKMLLTFDQDIQQLNYFYNELEKIQKNILNVNSRTKEYFKNNHYGNVYFGFDSFANYNLYKENFNHYLEYNNSIDFDKIINILDESFFFKNNYNNIIDVYVENNILTLYFYNKKDNIYYITLDIENYKILKNDLDFLKFDSFDKLDNISDEDFKTLYKKAQLEFYYLKHDYIINESYNFKDENCFISSSDLHGFYFPNIELKYKNYDFLCIGFLKGEAHAIFTTEENDYLLIL